MRTLTWLSMVVAAAAWLSALPEPAWSCPRGARALAAARSAPEPVHHLSHWRGPHGDFWTVAAQAQTCAELDLEDLARIGGVASVTCRRVEPRAVTVVVPAQLVDSGARDLLRGGVELEQLVPADVPVDIIEYDVGTEMLRLIVDGATPAAALDEARSASLRSDLTPRHLPMAADQSVIDWLAHGVVALGVNGHHRAVILVAPTPHGPHGVAAVQRALQLMPDAQYTVISSSSEGLAAHTPQLSGISNAGYVTAPVDARTLHRIVFQRFALESTASALCRHDCAERPEAGAELADETPAPPASRRRAAGSHSWLVVALVLWYVFGLKLAMYLMLHGRAPVPPPSGTRRRRP